MKDKIEGISKSRIIKSTEKVKTKSGEALFVNYLDGTQDVFDLNQENLDKVIEIADKQAQLYVTNKNKKIKDVKLEGIFLAIISVLTVLAVVTLKLGFNPITLSKLVALGILGCADLSFVIIYIKGKLQLNNVKKYDLFVNQIKTKLKDYQNILNKENSLTKEKNVTKVKSVLDVDKVSLKELKAISDKVERYQEIDKSKVKKMEKPSLY